MKLNWVRTQLQTLVPALVLVILGGVQSANAAGFLWISAPDWSYSAAAAATPGGAFYFWGLSAGVGSYSFAYAVSSDGLGDAAAAFAEAAAGNGGMGAVNVAGIADPWAGVGVDIGLTDPSAPGGFPTSKPGSDPLSSSWAVNGSSTGITLSAEGSELAGLDGLEAFVYTGGTDDATLQGKLGASSDGGTTAAGDASDIGSLESLFGGSLIPLDDLVDPGSSLSTLNFTENTASLQSGEVILVGEGEAEAPEPASLGLIGGALAFVGLRTRRRRQ